MEHPGAGQVGALDQIGTPEMVCGEQRAFSDEASQSNRDNGARDSEMMAPGVPG
jgi:hypothetical protein